MRNIFEIPLDNPIVTWYHEIMEVNIIKNIGFPVEDELYIKLKIVCLKKGLTLKDFMIRLIADAISKQEQEEK